MSKASKKHTPAIVNQILTPLPNAPLFSAFQEKLVWVFMIFMVGVFVSFYIYIAKLSSSGSQWLIADIIERWKIFSVDDSLRFYTSKMAFNQQEIYQSNYILPICLWLDGLIAKAVNGDLFLMRVAHLLPALATLWLTYITGVKIGVNRVVMSFSTLILACMPLYFFIYLSFYGENWLTLGIAALMAAFVYQRYFWLAIIAACLPLIRPEGLFFIIPLVVFFLYKRNFKLILIVGSLGFIYLLYLIYSLESIKDFYHWRLELREVMNYAPQNSPFYENLFFSSFNFFWLVPAFLGLFLFEFKKMWPFILSATIWILWNVVNLYKQITYYEARYFLCVMPMIVVGFGVFWSTLTTKILTSSKGGTLFIAMLLCSFIIGEHLLQLDPIKAKYGAAQRWPVQGALPLVKDFTYYPNEELVAREKTIDAIFKILKQNPKIDSLIISLEAFNLFYYLDPSAIPKNVKLYFTPLSGNISLYTLNNYFYVMASDNKGYRYFNLKTVGVDTQHLVLFVGKLDCAMCKSMINIKEYYGVYPFNYDVSYQLKVPSATK